MYWLFVTMAQAATGCSTPQVIEVPRADASALAVAVDGDLAVTEASGDSLRIEACEGTVRLIRRGSSLTIQARKPLSELSIAVPAGVTAVTVHDHSGATRIAVPARVAVVSSDGPLEVTGAASLRVAYHQGDVAADHVGGDLWVDSVSGAVRAGPVGGEAHLDRVAGAVEVEATGGLTVDGVVRTGEARASLLR